MDYKMMKARGVLNEVEPAAQRMSMNMAPQSMTQQALRMDAEGDYAAAHATDAPAMPRGWAEGGSASAARGGRKSSYSSGPFFTTINDGERVLAVGRDGRTEIIVGPKRVFNWYLRFRPMTHWVAHPGEFLVVRLRDGGQKHIEGPASLWVDPREHQHVECEDVLRLDAKEAVVVYAKSDEGAVTRRIVHGPAAFMPVPGEWLHSFSWHGSRYRDGRNLKIPNALQFQKLWLMPDQMYHDVPDVRTADDALLTVRLMLFFELSDIEKMLESTHDPIGDFVNAATSDVIDWVGRYDFDAFKKHTEQLNDIATYRNLASRAVQSGYKLHKVVYRGYGATDALQRMHDEAIESRTRLSLERATETQAQELEDAKLEREHNRASHRREDESAHVAHEIDLAQRRQQAAREQALARITLERTEREQDERLSIALAAARRTAEREHIEVLAKLGVDLTKYLTQDRPDQLIELRGGNGVPHLHLSNLPEPPR